MWFTENAWPPMLICLVLAALAWGMSREQRDLRRVALGLLVLCAGLWLIERAVVTDLERDHQQIEQRITELVRAFQQHDVAKVRSCLSPTLPALRDAAEKALLLVDVSSVNVKGLAVTRLDAQTLRSQFRATATVTVKNLNAEKTAPTRWKVDWQQQHGEWVIIAVTRLDPIHDEEIPLLH